MNKVIDIKWSILEMMDIEMGSEGWTAFLPRDKSLTAAISERLLLEEAQKP